MTTYEEFVDEMKSFNPNEGRPFDTEDFNDNVKRYIYSYLTELQESFKNECNNDEEMIEKITNHIAPMDVLNKNADGSFTYNTLARKQKIREEVKNFINGNQESSCEHFSNWFVSKRDNKKNFDVSIRFGIPQTSAGNNEPKLIVGLLNPRTHSNHSKDESLLNYINSENEFSIFPEDYNYHVYKTRNILYEELSDLFYRKGIDETKQTFGELLHQLTPSDLTTVKATLSKQYSKLLDGQYYFEKYYAAIFADKRNDHKTIYGKALNFIVDKVYREDSAALELEINNFLDEIKKLPVLNLDLYPYRSDNGGSIIETGSELEETLYTAKIMLHYFFNNEKCVLVLRSTSEWKKLFNVLLTQSGIVKKSEAYNRFFLELNKRTYTFSSRQAMISKINLRKNWFSENSTEEIDDTDYEKVRSAFDSLRK